MLRLFEQWDGDWTDVVDLWEATKTTRLEMWQSKTSGLKTADIFESFTCLSDSRADQLIIKDFEYLFPNAKASLLSWEQNYKKVLNQARNFRDECAKSLINQIDFMDDDGKYYSIQENKNHLYLFPENKMISSLVLIPYIMAPNGRRTFRSEAATKNEIQESFISIYEVC